MTHRDTGSHEAERQHDLKLAEWKLKISRVDGADVCLISVLFKELLLSAHWEEELESFPHKHGASGLNR